RRGLRAPARPDAGHRRGGGGRPRPPVWGRAGPGPPAGGGGPARGEPPGGGAPAACASLFGAGPARVTLLSVVAAPEGIARLEAEHPSLDIVTAAVDERLNDQSYIVPGLGDFGDRLFGT